MNTTTNAPISLKLAARVKLTNAVNAEALRVLRANAEAFRPLVGKKVFKADGTLTAQAAALVTYANAPEFHSYHHRNAYNLAIVIRASAPEPGRNGCFYYEQAVYIGNVTDGILNDVNPLEGSNIAHLTGIYDAQHIANKRAEFATAQKRADDLKSELSVFGAFDPH